MALLSLAHFTVVEAEPITLIEAAQAGGYDAIGLRIVPLFPTDHVFPVIGNPNLVRSIKRRLMETGIRVLDVEAIWLTAQSDIATLEPALDIAVELGAGYVIVAGNDPRLRTGRGKFFSPLSGSQPERGTGVVGIQPVCSFQVPGTTGFTPCPC